MPSLQADTGLHYRHIAKIDILNRTQPLFLTKGAMVVYNILSWTDGVVVFLASEPARPWSRHLYQVADSGGRGLPCITCDTKTSHGATCEGHDIRLSFKHSLYIEVCEAKGDADIMVKRMKDNSVVKNLRTAKKHPEKDIRSFYTKMKLPGDFSAWFMSTPEGLDEAKNTCTCEGVVGARK
eukprot:TRINITY_DN20703_c0_g1_i1.p1 TRINITY_DN20703_c0_g1~~TRINITY_DN20703_c0_g1_i1.p1  ORF type:complete len:181 (+),score=29.89 TRINITY_DN20703_c0_g1_i1:37-579(+)